MENRTIEILWIRLTRGEYETRYFKIMYNAVWDFPYKIYIGVRKFGCAMSRAKAHEMVLERVLEYLNDGWQIECGHIYKYYH